MDNSKRFKNSFKTRLITLLVLLILFFFINYLFSFLFLKEKLLKSKTYKIDSQFHRVKDKIEVLALGDSHASTGFDPRVFKNGFNFSVAGEKYIYNYYKLKYVLKTNKVLKMVVLPIDLHTFSTWGANNFLHDFYWIKYVNYLELGINKSEPLRFIRKYINGRFFPYMGEFESIFGITSKNKKKLMFRMPKITQGFIIRRENFIKEKRKQTRKRIFLQYYKQEPFDKTVTEYFKKILKLCSDNKIKLVLVKYPVTKIYYKFATRKVNVKEYYKKIFSMIKPYDNIKVVDMHNIFFENDSPYFYDPDHLNYKGARIHSTKIKGKLVLKSKKHK